MADIQYLCPSCLFLGINTVIELKHNILKCNVCENALRSATDHKLVKLLKTFYIHNKAGYHCFDCSRFVPKPNDSVVSCPYYDCMFVGDTSLLKKMHHPTARYLINVIDPPKLDDKIFSNIKLISNVIESEKNTLHYNSYDFTRIHKRLAYEAFSNLMNIYPSKMISYLLKESRSGGFQNKVFQEYIRLLEGALPFSIRKNKTFYKVDNLLNENLNLFDGVSEFEATINDKSIIKNNTEEFYIGGRKSAYAEPYYIGKLLNVVNKDTRQSVMDCVSEYSFSKIKMKGVSPGTKVIITHLRAKPHYQMGAMVYINRARKKIVELSKKEEYVGKEANSSN